MKIEMKLSHIPNFLTKEVACKGGRKWWREGRERGRLVRVVALIKTDLSPIRTFCGFPLVFSRPRPGDR